MYEISPILTVMSCSISPVLKHHLPNSCCVMPSPQRRHSSLAAGMGKPWENGEQSWHCQLDSLLLIIEEGRWVKVSELVKTLLVQKEAWLTLIKQPEMAEVHPPVGGHHQAIQILGWNWWNCALEGSASLPPNIRAQHQPKQTQAALCCCKRDKKWHRQGRCESRDGSLRVRDGRSCSHTWGLIILSDLCQALAAFLFNLQHDAALWARAGCLQEGQEERREWAKPMCTQDAFLGMHS